MTPERLAEIEALVLDKFDPEATSIFSDLLVAYKDLLEDFDSQTRRRNGAEIEMQKRGEENQRLLDALEAAKIDLPAEEIFERAKLMNVADWQAHINLCNGPIQAAIGAPKEKATSCSVPRLSPVTKVLEPGTSHSVMPLVPWDSPTPPLPAGNVPALAPCAYERSRGGRCYRRLRRVRSCLKTSRR